MKNILNLQDYFTDKELIKLLSHKRAMAAKKGHDDHFLRNISSEAESPHIHSSDEIFLFFPPRSKWIRLKKQERIIQGENSVKINSLQLERTVLREIKRCEKLDIIQPLWLKKLLVFTENIRLAVFDESLKYNLETPRTIPVLKDVKENTYRPISVFKLKDHIITGQIARYLSNCFDPLFTDSAYAFRTGITKHKVFNHHEAIEDIIKFKNKVGKTLYVSECDIKKFYDCVNHNRIKDEFQLIMQEAQDTLHIEIDKQAIHFFNSYLASFSFNKNVKENERELLRNSKSVNGKIASIPWVKDSELFEVNSDPINDRLGVPQGGAISCLIANILLNYVDKIVLAKWDENTFYGRFCDDMVLMHTEKFKCESLLEIYQKALLDVKLISHKPENFYHYGKQFWDEKLKSKMPYKWGINYISSSHSRKNVPWLSFVGYQIRYDGVVRVRQKSIAKELKKQVGETDKILNVVRRATKPNINKKAITFRLQQRLISMSISRFRFGTSNISMCWCAGFRVLKNNNNITNQIRRLDRNREKQIKRIKRFLYKVETPELTTNLKVKSPKYYGHNYSYNKQFINKEYE